MSSNADLAGLFDDMASALELLGANPFRANAHARVARALRDMTDDIATFVKEDPDTAPKRLAALPGIGKSTATKIQEWVETGRMSDHEELLEKVPSGLFQILEIPGLGPKTVRMMWEQMGITSLTDLKAHLDSPELAQLPRMGKKTIENMRKAISFAERSGERIPLGRALPLAESIIARLEAIKGVKRVAYAGSLRRGCETIGDLDFLCTCEDDALVADTFCEMDDVTQVLVRGETKCSVRLDTGRVVAQADLRIVPDDVWGAAWMYFSGSKEHNIKLRERAIAKDLHLNEYGLFKGTDERPQDTGETPVAAKSEADIYKALDLPFIPPELREEWRGMVEPPDDLIEIDDIKAELHCHTTASDGKLSIDELVAAAKSRGLETIAITDHSVSSVLANGLDVDRLRKHIAAIRDANDRIDGITVLAGSEVDILVDGTLDYDDDVLAELDIVVASPHASLRQSREDATTRLMKAITNPFVHIIGHPTGRMVGRREGLQPDFATLFAAAAEHDTALEINANPRRLDLRDQHVRAALDAGCKIAIDTDAHDADHFDYLRYGVMTGRRGALGTSRCINAWSTKSLLEWARSKRGNA